MGNIRRISKKYYLRQIVACFLVCCLFFNTSVSVVMAEVVMTSNPMGTITVTPLGGGTTQSMTATNGAIGNFSDFDILAGRTVTCLQPNASANALFKVFSGDGTQIYGTFTANGGIWLIDTAGILVGSGGAINVPRLVASSLNVNNQDFLDFTGGAINQMKFQGGLGAGVTNRGTITASNSAYLVGKNVINAGTIISGGLVVMAAGDKVWLGKPGSPVIVQTLSTPTPGDHVVTNTGDTGTLGVDPEVEQLVLAAGDIFSNAISNVGDLAAVANRDITLSGPVAVSGDVTLVANADGSGVGDVDIEAGITQSGGNFTSSGVDFDNTGGVIDTTGASDGAIAINHTGTVTLGADLESGVGAITGTATSIEVASNDAEIQDAIEVAHATDGADITVFGPVTKNTYNENLNVDKPDITLQSKDTDTVTLAPTSGDIISVTAGGDNFILGGALDQGFTVDTTNGASTGVSAGGTTGLTVSHNTFTADNDDTSIEAQDVVDLLITNNRFTGSSAVGLDLASVTGSSSVQSNVIDSYDVGIKVSNGTGTDGLSISGNDILNNTTGILFSQSGAGNTENVSVEYNMLTNNTTGLKVEDGDHVLAETFTTQYNGFEGGTTGLANENTFYEVTAEKNWWGAADGPGDLGPGSGVDVSATGGKTVDYSPWLGIGDDDGGTIGFQMASPMTWWTNDVIQDAIDAASSGDRINVVAGSYSDPVNVNKQLDSLWFMGTGSSGIGDTLTLLNNDNWDGGVLGIYTENENLTLNAVTDPDPGVHSLTLDTGTATTLLYRNVTVNGDLTLMSNTNVVADRTLYAGEDVILAAGKGILGTRALTIMTDAGDILLGDDLGNPDPTVGFGGNVSMSAGNLILDAGDSIYAHGELTTTLGSIDLYSSDNTTHLYGNVTADVTDPLSDIIIHNRSEVADGVTLTAGDDVTILELMEAQGNLTIVAAGGAIEAADVFMTVDDSLLSLTQNDSLDMEQAFDDVINSSKTDLFATSTGGSVTSSKADRWQTIAAVAETFINLNDSDTGGDIRTKALTAGTDILITSDLGKVYADSSITAGQDVKITAKNEGPLGEDYSIDLNENVDAGRDIWLNNNTLADGGVEIDAGQDVRVGWDETHLEYDPKTLTGKAALTVEADRHITLGGDVTAGTAVVGNLILKADAGNNPPGTGVGNMTALGNITNPGGSIDIFSSDTTTYLWDDVTALGDIILHNDTEVKASGKTLQSTGDDVVLAGGKTLDSDYDLTILAGDDIILGITNTADTEGSQTTGSAGDVTADGLLTLTAGDDVYAHGTLTTTDGSGGDIDIRSSDTTTYLWGDVTADQTTGGSIFLNNTTWAADDVKLDAGLDVIVGNGGADGTMLTGEGTLTVEADRHITLGGAVVASDTTSGNLILKADADTVDDPVEPLGDNVGDMTAFSTIANLGGSIDIYSSDDTTYLHDDVTASVDITLHNDTEVWADKTLDAGRDVVVDDGKTLDGQGNLTVRADHDITLGGATGTVGNLNLYADDNADNDGDLLAKQAVTSGGYLDAYGNNITFEGPASSATYMYLQADSTNDGTGDLVTQALTSGDYLEAYGDNITINGAAESGTDAAAADKYMYLYADSTNNGSGDLLARDSVTSGSWLQAYGDDITFEGPVSSATWMYLHADYKGGVGDGSGDLLAKQTVTSGSYLYAYGNNITFEGPVSSATYMYLQADSTWDDSGDLVTNSLTSGTWLHAYGDNITINGAAESGDSMILQADSTNDGSGDLTTQGLTSGTSLQAYGNNITIGALAQSGTSMRLKADSKPDDSGDLTTQALTSGTWLKAYGNNITINGAAESGDSMILQADSTNDGSGDLLAKQTVTSGDYLNAYGNNITFEGPVSSTTQMYLRADSFGDGTGDLVTNSLTSGTYIHAYGNNITIGALAQSGTSMYLRADSTNNGTGDLVTNSLTSGTWLEAYGNNITIGALAQSGGYMYLRADSTNNGTGDLVTQALTSGDYLEAYGDNITINGAAESGTDAGAADKYMHLQADSTNDGSGDLLAKQSVTSGGYLEAYGDDITFEGPASSATSMYLKADSKPDGSGDLVTNSLTSGTWLQAYGDNITIGALAQSGGYMHLEADSTWDDSGDLTTQALTSGGYLGAYGDNITINGAAQSGTDALAPDKYMYLKADSTDDGEGDLWAQNTISSGSYLYAYADDITFDAPVSSTTYMYLRADYKGGVGDGTGDLVTNSLTSGTWLEAYGNNITIGALAQSGGYMYLEADSTYDDSGDLTTQGLTSGSSLQALGNNITFEGPASSASWMWLEADSTGDGTGDLLAKQSVTSGNYLQALGNNITFEGPVSSGSWMWLKADSTDDGSGDLLAKASVTSGSYLEAYGDDITFEGPVSSASYMLLEADRASDGTGSVDVHGLDAGGDIDIYAADNTDNTINIHKSAVPAAVTDVHSGQDIRLWNNTVADDGVIIDAGVDVTVGNAADGTTLTGKGALTVQANRHITLGGLVEAGTQAAGDLILAADAEGDNVGNMTAHDDVINDNGNIIISSADSTTFLNGDEVRASGNVNLQNNTVAADGILIKAVLGDVVVGVETETVDPADYPGMPGLLPGVYTDTYLKGDGALTVEAGSDIIVGGDLTTGETTAGAMTLTAGDNISVKSATSKLGTTDIRGNMVMTATNGNITAGNLKPVYDFNPDGDLVFEGGYLQVYTNARGDMTLSAPAGDISFKVARAYGKDIGGGQYQGGNMNMTAGGDIAAGVIAPAIYGYDTHDEVVTITQGGKIYSSRDMTLLAGNDIKAKWVDSGDNLMNAGHDILIGGVFPALAGYIYDTDGQQDTDDSWGTTQAEVLNVHKGGKISSREGMTLLAGNDIKLKAAFVDDEITMTAGRDILVGGLAPHAVELDGGGYGTAVFDKGGRLDADGAVTLTAGRDISLKMVRAEDDITMTAVDNITLRTNLPGPSWDEPTDRTESYEGDIRLHALNGDISIVEGYKLIAGELYYEEDVYGGGVSLIADNGKIYSPGGDNDTLNITIEGYSSQLDDIGVELPLDADKKAAIVIISKEDLKLGPDSVLLADGDYIPLHVINLGGITSFEELESYWEALTVEYGDVMERLKEGFEDYLEDLGYDVDLEDLEDFSFSLLKELLGDYLGSLDDRPAVGFLDVPATIGGIPRNEGAPIDVAVYLASTEGDVEVQMYIGVDIWAGDGVEIGEPEPSIYVERGGTIVVDAYDTVTFGDSGLNINLIDVDWIDDIGDLEQMFDDLSDALLNQYGIEIDTADFLDAVEAYFVALGYTSPEEAFVDPAFIGHLENFLGDYLEDQLTEDGRFIDRLEVCSRITEWLFQASLYGTLPYPYNPEIVEAFIGGDYILRGAGLGNIDITDGRAWVLVDPVPPAPLYTEAGEAAEEEEFAEGGCPPLMEWLAIEIGVPAEDIQVALAGTLALNTDIQPCEMCARLMDASKSLEDVEGTRIAALARVVNEFVATPAPPSEEQMTLIAAALAEHVGDGTYYATAEQWLDSLVAYIGIMNTEMGYSASDSVAFAEKYLTPVTETGSVSLIAYVEARVAALGG